MATVEVRIDRSKPLREDPATGHNRWHPDLPAVARIRPGDELILETRDALDGQIGPGSTIETVAAMDSNVVHPLTGPIHVEGSRPGDLLEVEIVDIVPDDFGYTTQSTAFGFLRDFFPDPYLVRWRLDADGAVSEDVPGVRVPAAPFMGVIGVAPDQRLMEMAVAREQAAIERGEFLFPPTEPAGAVPAGPHGQAGLRTGPPREQGGNLDIKQTVKGTRMFFPVFVDGALFSAGDAHFAQGDGEVCGQAIEMCATLTARFTVHEGRAAAEGITQTRFICEEPATVARQFFVTTGLSLADDGTNYSENATLAARRALLDMIDYLGSRGLDRQAAYALCSVAVDLRISELVDVPNVVVSAFLPLDIFT
jgi:formamidase